MTQHMIARNSATHLGAAPTSVRHSSQRVAFLFDLIRVSQKSLSSAAKLLKPFVLRAVHNCLSNASEIRSSESACVENYVVICCCEYCCE